MTVNDLIERLQTHAAQGKGDHPVITYGGTDNEPEVVSVCMFGTENHVWTTNLRLLRGDTEVVIIR